MPWYKIPNRLPRHVRVRGGRKVAVRANTPIRPRLVIKPVRFNRGPRPRPPVHSTPSFIGGGMDLATTIAASNFENRFFRQPHFLASQPMLQTATHTPNPSRMYKAQKMPQNNILPISTTMPVTYKKAFPAKVVYRPKSKATNRKNTNNLKTVQPKSATQVLQKEVKALKQAVNTINSTHIYKKITAGALKSLVGKCNHFSWQGSSLTNLETFCANLRFFDPATPGTLITANPNTGTYARDINFKNIYCKFMMRNNYQVPVKVKLYLCKAKLDTNTDALATYKSALTDQVITSADETTALVYVTDIERMKENWNIDCVVDKVLEPGQEASASHSTGPISYDPSHMDLLTDNFQKSFKAFEFMLRVEGVLGHDTAVTTELSQLLAGVDVQLLLKADIEYNSGGADLRDIYLSEGRPTAFTNGGVVSLKPIADNIAYSIA